MSDPSVFDSFIHSLIHSASMFLFGGAGAKKVSSSVFKMLFIVVKASYYKTSYFSRIQLCRSLVLRAFILFVTLAILSPLSFSPS